MGFKRFFRRAQYDRDQLEEIESYVQIEADENLARGMSEQDAYAAARRKFGNVSMVREEIYRMNSLNIAEAILSDIRYGFRTLRQHFTFTAVALITLAVGIGANTAVFSVVNGVLLKPLSYPNPDQLVALRQIAPGAQGLSNVSDGFLLSSSMYVTYDDHNRSFQSMGVWQNGSANVTGMGRPEEVRNVAVSDGVLQTLAVPPAAGRWLTSGDQRPNGSRNLLLGYGYWQRRFGGSPSAVGKMIQLDNQSWQIVGVMPRAFRVVTAEFDVLTPLSIPRTNLPLAGFGLRGIARLKPGVTIAQANADLARLLPIWMDSWTNGPGSDPHFYLQWHITPAIRPLKTEVTGTIGNVLWVVMGTIGLVMLMACANVTNLMLVRVGGRQREIAVRLAIGAGRLRVVSTLLAESGILALGGCLLGVGLAWVGVHLLLAIGPGQLPRLDEIALNRSAISFAVLLAILSSLFLGLIPALKYVRPQLADSLRSGGRSATISRERHYARNVLVAAQVALALVLICGAGLMIRTFQAIHSVQPGFTDASHLQTMRISIPDSLVPNPKEAIRVQNTIADKLAAIPGVNAAAFGSEMPMEFFGSGWDEMFAENITDPNSAPPMRLFKSASPGFFSAAGTRILAGRDISWNDVYNQRPVLLISANLARELWHSPADAIGKRLREYSGMPWHEVIGVVEDVHESGVTEEAPATVYWSPVRLHFSPSNLPAQLGADRDVTFVLRTSRAGTEDLVRQMQQAVWSISPQFPIASVRTMQETYNDSLARPSFTLVMLAIAGTIALILGIVGVYGVISYAVSERQREIGIRLAFGAQNSELKTMFVRMALKVSGIGALVGLAIAVALSGFMRSLIFNISPLDPLTFVIAPLLLAISVILASYLPARRATLMNAAEVLSAE
jgi:predicted permease